MLISWDALKQFIALDESVDDVAERLTFSGSEVEAITHSAGKMNGVITAKIISISPHKDNHKYSVVTLDTGRGSKICITSATNMHQDDTVFYAPEGSTLPDGSTLGVRDFLGIDSFGMMLSALELGLHDVDDPSGLLILPHDVQSGINAASLFHLGDTILDVSITPNRGDLLSHLGMARELKGLFPHSQLLVPEWMTPLQQNSEWPVHFSHISLIDDGCYAYRLGLVTGASIAPSPLTARIDLAHLGMRPINNAVDITNYIMLMLGQPLHAFDLNTLPEHEITVRPANQGEVMTTLDGKNRVLTHDDMLITSGGQAVALAGVMGGLLTGINDNSSTIVIESASFSAVKVGRTSRRLGITSEAAFRFARTVDPKLSAIALNAASSLMHNWCGGNVNYAPITAITNLPSPKTITLTAKKLSVYLSWSDMNEARNILSGFGINAVNENEYIAPSWRPDITIEEDLIEEIGRFRGYNDVPDKLPGEMPKRADIGSLMRLTGKLRELLMSRGYTEVMTYSFLPADFTEMLRLNDERAKPIMIANPISREQSAMRTTLLPGLIMGLKAVLDGGYRYSVRTFEQGRVFLNGGEYEHIAGLVYAGRDRRTVHGEVSEGFYDVKADVEAILNSRGYYGGYKAEHESYMHDGQCAGVYVNGGRVGVMGRLKPEIEQHLELEGVYVYELETSILEHESLKEYIPPRVYPSVERDISLMLSEGVSSEEAAHDIASKVKGVLKTGGVELLSVRMFDEYISDGKRSAGYSVSYGSKVRTLTDAEVDEVHNAVRAELMRAGYELR